jgi:hypothetical protein
MGNKMAVAKSEEVEEKVEAEVKIEASKTLEGHGGPVNALALLSNGRLLSGSKNKTIKLWDVAKGQRLKTLEGHGGAVLALALLPDGKLLSGGREDRKIKLWDVKQGLCLKTLMGHGGAVLALALLPDGRLLSGAEDKTIKLWDVEQGLCLKTLMGHRGEVYALALLPDGRLLSGSGDETIKLWDVEQGQCLKTLEGHEGAVTSLVLMPDGRLLSGGREDGKIKLWDVKQGRCLNTLDGHGGPVWALALLPDGRLLSGSDDKTIKMWDVEQGQCLKTLDEHSDRVNVLALMPDGRLLSGSDDKTIKLWDLRGLQLLKERIPVAEMAEVAAVPVQTILPAAKPAAQLGVVATAPKPERLVVAAGPVVSKSVEATPVVPKPAEKPVVTAPIAAAAPTPPKAEAITIRSKEVVAPEIKVAPAPWAVIQEAGQRHQLLSASVQKLTTLEANHQVLLVDAQKQQQSLAHLQEQLESEHLDVETKRLLQGRAVELASSLELARQKLNEQAEQQHIMGKLALAEYYLAFQWVLNDTLISAKAVHGEFTQASDDHFKAQKVGGYLKAVGDAMPIAGIVLKVLGAIAQKWGKVQQVQAVNRLASFCVGAASLEAFAEHLARQLALYQEQALLKFPVPGRSIVDRLKALGKKVTADCIDTAIKGKAEEDVERLVRGILEGKIPHPAPAMPGDLNLAPYREAIIGKQASQASCVAVVLQQQTVSRASAVVVAKGPEVTAVMRTDVDTHTTVTLLLQKTAELERQLAEREQRDREVERQLAEHREQLERVKKQASAESDGSVEVDGGDQAQVMVQKQLQKDKAAAASRGQGGQQRQVISQLWQEVQDLREAVVEDRGRLEILEKESGSGAAAPGSKPSANKEAEEADAVRSKLFQS